MCMLCADSTGNQSQALRAYLLQLLALVERADALPMAEALRLGREILALTEPGRTERRCDAVPPPEPAIKETY